MNARYDQREAASPSRRWTRVRIHALAFLVLCGAGLVLHRAYSLQVKHAGQMRSMARAQHLRQLRLAPKRGSIFDRYGQPLAVSVQVESAWANPREIRRSGRDMSSVLQSLERILGRELSRARRSLHSSRYFVWIKRHVTPQQAQAIRELKVPGLYLTQEARRYYPNKELAAHLIGFANVDGVGIEGLELSFEKRLRGGVRSVTAVRDRWGKVVYSEHLLDDASTQGEHVVLTLDKYIQHVAERELNLAAQTFEAKAASIVVMDPNNGEILALANYPTFNPNKAGSFPARNRRNRAVTDRYEPGSTLKPFTIAAALASGTLHPRSQVDCENGAMQVADFTIHDSHPFAVLTPTQILAHSSNIGTAKVGRELGRKRLYRYLRKFGFGQVTGLPLPGETKGLLRHYRKWYELDAATISFGQGLSVTSVQLASAVSVLANGGRLMRPILVKRVTDHHNAVIEQASPTVVHRVIPAEVAQVVSRMMTAVTREDGTGREAAIEGFKVAGKTGTAQKADMRGGYSSGRWLASFVGYVPSEQPRLAIVVTVDEPVIDHYGGSVAAPLFRRVAKASLQHLGISHARHLAWHVPLKGGAP